MREVTAHRPYLYSPFPRSVSTLSGRVPRKHSRLGQYMHGDDGSWYTAYNGRSRSQRNNSIWGTCKQCTRQHSCGHGILLITLHSSEVSLLCRFLKSQLQFQKAPTLSCIICNLLIGYSQMCGWQKATCI